MNTHSLEKDLPEVMTENQLLEYARIPAGSLRQDRYLNQGIPYVKIGQRVRYLRRDLIAYLKDHYVDTRKKNTPAM